MLIKYVLFINCAVFMEPKSVYVAKFGFLICLSFLVFLKLTGFSS